MTYPECEQMHKIDSRFRRPLLRKVERKEETFSLGENARKPKARKTMWYLFTEEYYE